MTLWRPDEVASAKDKPLAMFYWRLSDVDRIMLGVRSIDIHKDLRKKK